IYTSVPPLLGGHLRVLPGVPYPTYRAAIIVVGVAVAILLWVLVTRTRLGMLIRAGASNRTMVGALGVNIRLLDTTVFGLGGALALGVGGLALALVPPLAAALNQPFYLDLFRRMMIFALAAASLDLILCYGGMVSFGHAAYLGIGAYAVGIPAFHGVDNGFVQWSVAVAASAVAALVIGAISIRTSGVYFIMITLAFTQMLYYLGISLETYGGDNGMPLRTRSQFAGLVDLRNPSAFYYLVLALLVLFLVLGRRLVDARFGRV